MKQFLVIDEYRTVDKRILGVHQSVVVADTWQDAALTGMDDTLMAERDGGGESVLNQWRQWALEGKVSVETTGVYEVATGINELGNIQEVER